MSNLAWKWFVEFSHPEQAHLLAVDKYVYCCTTPFQDVEIIDTGFYGRCLVLDGKIQSTRYDEYIYHETLVHPAILFHPEPRNILVVGGGEGAVLREVLKYPSVEKAVMVDIDREVVKICRHYLPEWSMDAFDDPRVELLFLDARKYLEDTNKQFDLIYIDITEPLNNSPAYLLFTREFYRTVKQRLSENGVIALQAGDLNPKYFHCHGAISNTLKQVFKEVHSYGAFIPSYNTTWGFICASERFTPSLQNPEAVDEKLLELDLAEKLEYYDGFTHMHLFTLPKNIRQLLEREKRIIEDENPLFIY